MRTIEGKEVKKLALDSDANFHLLCSQFVLFEPFLVRAKSKSIESTYLFSPNVHAVFNFESEITFPAFLDSRNFGNNLIPILLKCDSILQILELNISCGFSVKYKIVIPNLNSVSDFCTNGIHAAILFKKVQNEILLSLFELSSGNVRNLIVKDSEISSEILMANWMHFNKNDVYLEQRFYNTEYQTEPIKLFKITLKNRFELIFGSELESGGAPWNSMQLLGLRIMGGWCYYGQDPDQENIIEKRCLLNRKNNNNHEIVPVFRIQNEFVEIDGLNDNIGLTFRIYK